MAKLLKYNLKENSRFFLGVILFICGFSTYFQISLLRELNNAIRIGAVSVAPGTGAIVGIGLVGLIGATIATFFKLVGGYHKELKEDRGYLTFTLPLSGKQILGVKILTAFIWYAIIMATIAIFNFILGLALFGSALTDLIKIVGELLAYSWFPILLMSTLDIFVLLVLVYFAMTLCNISIRNKKYSGIWFVVYLVLVVINSFLQGKVMEWIPYYFNFANMSIEHISKLNIFNLTDSMYANPFFFFLSQEGVQGIEILGIGSFLYSLTLVIVLFFTISYMLENKIDI